MIVSEQWHAGGDLVSSSGNRPKKDERYIVRSEFEAIVLTHWLAPITDGYRRTIPVGLEFVVIDDPPLSASALAGRPKPYEFWEYTLVSQADRANEKYGGYSLVVPFDLLGAHCEKVSRPRKS